jgi:heme A synthase
MSHLARKRQSQQFPGSAQSVQAAYDSLRRAQRGLAGMIAACALLGCTVLRGPAGALGNRIYLPVIVSTLLLTFAYSFRSQTVAAALDELRRNPRDPRALRRWQRDNLIVLALVAAVGVTGFGLQLFGAPAPIALVLYAISIAYLFLLRPVKP